MSTTREYRFRTFVELAFTVEVDAEGENPEFEAKGVAEQKAESLARKVLGTTKISSQLSSKVREAFKAGQGREILVQPVPAQRPAAGRAGLQQALQRRRELLAPRRSVVPQAPTRLLIRPRLVLPSTRA